MIDQLKKFLSKKVNSQTNVQLGEGQSALFVGCMGTGKSRAASLFVSRHIQKNSGNVKVVIYDPCKGAQDYAPLKNLSNVHFVTDDREEYPLEGLKKTMDYALEEYRRRRNMFQEHGVENISEYEQETSEVLQRLVIVIEEFHLISKKTLDGRASSDDHVILGKNILSLLRDGKCTGISFVLSSARGHPEDIPKSVLERVEQKFVFRVSRKESEYLTGCGASSEIGVEQIGFAYNEGNLVQFSS